MSIQLVVDSSADIDLQRAAENALTIVPLTVAFGEEVFRDYVEIAPDEFFRRMAATSQLPKTSMPPTTAFEDAYRRLISDGATSIISAHLPPTFSGTLNAARLAAEAVTKDTGVPITLIDSGTVSAGLGTPMLHAAKMLRDGATETQLVTYLRDAWQRGKTYLLLDTLTNLEKGGRIGHAQAFVGAMLSIKPILTFKDGVVTPLERVRTRAKALNQFRELLVRLSPLAEVGIVTSDPTTYTEFEALVRTVYDGPIVSFAFGAVVGTYAGPRSGGVFAVPQG